MRIPAVQQNDLVDIYESICALEEVELPFAAFSACFQKALNDSTLYYIAARKKENGWDLRVFI